MKVHFLIGVPCSGKSTYRSHYFKDAFIISRDDIREQIQVEKNVEYGDFFIKPLETDPESHPKFGLKTPDGHWSFVKEINSIMDQRYNDLLNQAKELVSQGTEIVVDLLNLRSKERLVLIDLFKSVSDKITFHAYVFEFENNLPLILTLNQKRFEETNKLIPEHLYKFFIEGYQKPEEELFQSIEYVDGLAGLK